MSKGLLCETIPNTYLPDFAFYMSFTFLLFIEKDIVISFTSLGRKKERIKVFARIISEFSSSLTYTHTHIRTHTHTHTNTHTLLMGSALN